MTSVRFGTDGIRGVAGEHPITPDVARRLGFAVVQELGVRELYVARDTRAHGEDLALAVCEGAAAAGATPSFKGVWPTPALACELAAHPEAAGVMVTASHNAHPDNGFKVLVRSGQKPRAAQIEHIEQALNRRAIGSEPIEGAARTGSVPKAWLDALHREGAALGMSWAHKRIAFDFANGAARPWRSQVMKMVETGWEVLGADGGQINQGTGSEALNGLCRAVVEKGCAIGFAIDGDGDRLRVVDERGVVVAGDAVTWALARAARAGSVAVTVMSNGALEGHLPGVTVHRTPVGDQHLQEAMRTQELPLGAEESGHILFAEHAGGDGVFAAFRVLAALTTHAGGASDLFGGFTPMPRQQFKMPVTARVPLDNLDGLDTERTRWLAALGEGGRVFLRYSGTEPVLRVLVEGPDGPSVAATSGRVRGYLQSVLG